MRAKKRHDFIMNTCIILIFLTLSIINVLFLWHLHIIHMKSLDMSFHWQRIGELLKNNSLLPGYATNLFSGNGSAVMTMYPYLFLYPFAFLYLKIKSVIICSFIMFIINTFLTLMISYYSTLSFSQSKLVSFIFAVFYSISSYITVVGLDWFYIGELYAFIFMPLVIFGFIYYLKNNKWVMLSIGMTLIVYSSVIMTVIVPLLLLLWLILNYKNITKNRIKSLIKSITLTTMSSMLFIIPALRLIICNKLNTPHSNIFSSNLFNLLSASMNNYNYPYDALTIYSILGIIVGLIIFNKLSNMLKQAYIIALIVVFLSSNYFPWPVLNKTIFSTIQYTGRILLFPQVILTYIFTLFIYKLLILYLPNHIHLGLFILLILIISCQVSNQQLMSNKIYKNIPASNKIIDCSSYQAQIHHMSAFDYYPVKSLKYKKDLLFDRGFCYRNNIKHTIPFKLKGNGTFIFKNKSNVKRLVIPFLYYKGTEYRGALNSKKIKLHENKAQILYITDIKRGKYLLHINIQLSKSIIIARIITLLSLLIYVYLLYKKLKYSKLLN